MHRMLKRALLALVAAAGLAAPAGAQDASGLLGLLASGPPAREAPAAIETRSYSVDEAVLATRRLADDVLVLSRIALLQLRLLETNATRHAAGAAPLLLPRRICEASPLGPLCGRLPHTFAPGTRP